MLEIRDKRGTEGVVCMTQVYLKAAIFMVSRVAFVGENGQSVET